MSVGGIFECYEKPYEVLDYNALKDDPLIDPATHRPEGFLPPTS